MPFRPGVLALSVGLVVFCAGCRVPPRTELPPPLAASISCYVGSPLSGPTDRAMAEQLPEDVPEVDVTVVALDHSAAGLGAPLGSRARLIVSQRGDAAVQPSARLTQDTRILDGPNVIGAWSDLVSGRVPASLTGVLPSGVTTAFRLDDLAPLQDPVTGQAARRGVTLQVARVAGDAADGELLVSLAVDELVAGVPPAAGPPALVLQSESALFDVPAPGGEAALALLVPFRPTGTDVQTIAILAQVSPGKPGPSQDAAIARCQAEVERSRAELGRPSHFALIAGGSPVSVRTALALMDVPGQRRAALVFLAGQTGATLSRDLMLTVDDALLEKLAVAVRAKVPADVTDLDAVGWQMEQAVLQAVVEMSARGALPPEATAVLTAHYGEAGRHAESLQEISGQMASPAEFKAAVVEENTISLEDYSPGERVRAFEWLQARGSAPAGYDPLAPPRERRAALDRAEATAADDSPDGDRP